MIFHPLLVPRAEITDGTGVRGEYIVADLATPGEADAPRVAMDVSMLSAGGRSAVATRCQTKEKSKRPRASCEPLRSPTSPSSRRASARRVHSLPVSKRRPAAAAHGELGASVRPPTGCAAAAARR